MNVSPLDENRNPLGGPGRTIEMFGNDKYYTDKPANDVWVFGTCERESRFASMPIVTG